VSACMCTCDERANNQHTCRRLVTPDKRREEKRNRNKHTYLTLESAMLQVD
jgi:hypothetical protein